MLADAMHVPLFAASITITNVPVALTEVAGLYRVKVDLTQMSRFRVGDRVGVQAAAGGTLRVQYSTDEVSWSNLGQGISLVGVGTKATVEEDVPQGAKADVVLRVVTEGGNAVDDPQIRGVWVQAY